MAVGWDFFTSGSHASLCCGAFWIQNPHPWAGRGWGGFLETSSQTAQQTLCRHHTEAFNSFLTSIFLASFCVDFSAVLQLLSQIFTPRFSKRFKHFLNDALRSVSTPKSLSWSVGGVGLGSAPGQVLVTEV